MDTVPQTVNCVDVLPRTSRHLHSHLLWTSLEPGHCHCAVCLMEPHMNISKPSVNKSNTGVRTLISHHNRRTLVTLKILFFDESHARCVRLGRSAYNTTDHSGVLHAHMITNLYIDWYRSRVLTLWSREGNRKLRKKRNGSIILLSS